MTVCTFDFETRSCADLKEVGAVAYAQHPTTQIWCMAYAFDDGPVQVWTPDQPFPMNVALYVRRGGEMVAHNVNFELAIWKHIVNPRFDVPVLTPEQCTDTMLLALTMGLPGKLEKAVQAARLNIEKDMTGHRLMLRMSRPRRIEPDGTIVWWNDANRIARLIEYCKADVEAERALLRYCQPLSEREQRVAAVDREINTRGVYIDRKLAEAALSLTEQMKRRLDNEMSELTAGMVEAAGNAPQLTTWLRSQGVDTDSVAKPAVAELLRRDLPHNARRALELRQKGAKSSNAKIGKMLARVNAEGRITDTMQQNAAATGRWGGRLIQPQNLPRPEILHDDKDIEEAVLYVRTGDIAAIERVFGPPLVVVSDLLRSMICAPPGKELIVGDWSAIEGRGLPWLAGEDWKVKAYRDHDRGIGEEVYRITAGRILGKAPGEITKAERHALGKTPELALQYEGGAGAFDTMADTLGVDMTQHYDAVEANAPPNDLERAKEAYALRGVRTNIHPLAWVASETIKIGWRRDHPAIVAYWGALERAAIQAVENPDKIFGAGPQDHRRIRFRMVGDHLYCRLPSGRKICYPWPELKKTRTSWGAKKTTLTYETVNMQGQWVRTSTYGGKLSENVTQAVCSDILREALLLLKGTIYDVVMHVHDEIVSEVEKGKGCLNEFTEKLCAQIDWAFDLPLAASVWRGKRFKKD